MFDRRLISQVQTALEAAIQADAWSAALVAARWLVVCYRGCYPLLTPLLGLQLFTLVPPPPNLFAPRGVGHLGVTDEHDLLRHAPRPPLPALPSGQGCVECWRHWGCAHRHPPRTVQ